MKNTKEKVLKIALELFSQRGYSNVSMDDIKDTASVAKGTLYYHFESKDGLFNETCQYFFEQIKSYVVKKVGKEIVDTKEDYYNIVLASIDYLWDNYENVRMFFLSSREHFEKNFGAHDLFGNVLNIQIDVLKKLGFKGSEAKHIAPMIVSLWMTIFPGRSQNFFTNKKFYKEKALSVVKTLIGGIDEV
ncbi:TetR/AcrR family transcriptional regulator [bacterium]|nr:TetR/AcrR family transcriptional regulator [bacterium]